MLGAVLRGSPALRKLAWGAVAVGVVTPLVRHRLRLRAPVVSVLAWQAPVALALAAPRSPLRDAGIYALQMWAYFAHFDMPDDDPEALLGRLKVDYPIRFDRALGARHHADHPAAARARAGRRDPAARPRALVRCTGAGSSCPTARWRTCSRATADLYPRSAMLMAACFDLGCVVYWAVPTAPPWWAGENGNMPPVRRIMAEAGERFWGRLWRPLYHSLQGNPFAAMPSLHFGTSVMAARVLSGVGRGPGALGWTYALTLGFGLVYLGEHYVVDLLAGFALAERVWRAAPKIEPWAKLLAGGIQRLEPRLA